MKAVKPFFLMILAAFAGCILAQPVRADEASCKPVTNAAERLARTPYHEVSATDGKPFEKIYTTTTLSIRISNGEWMTMPMTPQELLESLHKAGSYSNCKALRTEIVDGQRATVYIAHRTSPGTSAFSQADQIWIAASGLTLKAISEVQVQGRKIHAETHVTYANVQAPTGAQ